MAPEYLYQGIITNKADIYSFGVIIIEVVSGRKIIPYATGNFCIDFELVRNCVSAFKTDIVLTDLIAFKYYYIA